MLVKTLLGSLFAKLAMGMGVAAASVTAVGAAGALPAPVQHAMASVVAATTPFVLPDPSSGTTVEKVGTGGESTATAPRGDDASAEDSSGHDRAANHGACVSAAARDKSATESHGKTVSSVARSDCGKTTTSSTLVATTSTTLLGSTTTSSTSTTLGNAARTANSGPGSVNSGKEKSRESDTVTTKAGGEDDKGSGSGKGRSASSGKD